MMDWSTVEARIQAKAAVMAERMGNRSPHAAVNGIYDNRELAWWTSGFWPGILWIMYDRTREERYRELAWEWDERLEPLLLEGVLDHDAGFQFLPSAVLKYKLTGEEAAKRRAIAAANYLMSRFNAAGRFLRAWNGERAGWAIIDSVMNLPLLFWAAEASGDPRYGHIACAHADTLMQHFVRPDGSVRHIVSFDPLTGEFIEAIAGQGFAPDSAWSRGQAWALHGFAVLYRYTSNDRYLNQAKSVAHYFIAALSGQGVPPWDFRLPKPQAQPRDTSAAACAASGLLELAGLTAAQEARIYTAAAERILAELTEHYACFGTETECLLRKGTSHVPEQSNINAGLIYGDYFYVEAIAKLSGWQHRVF